MKQLKLLHFMCLAALVFSLFALPASAVDDGLMNDVFVAAEGELGALDAENILIITDIGSPAESYVYLDDFYAEFYGNGLLYTKNLLVVQNARNSPLWFAFFDKNSGNCTFIYLKDGKVVSEPEVNIALAGSPDAPLYPSDPYRLDDDMISSVIDNVFANKTFMGREFAIVTIANAWATGDLDYELMQCLEIHNHFCPGVSSGYVLANWMETNYPLNEGVSYTVFSCPNWCKEDVFVKRWDATPGKSGTWVAALTDEEKAALGGSPAGIFVVSDSGNMKAVVLGFDFDLVREGCGGAGSDWVSKYKMDLWLMNESNWNKEGLVYEIEVIDIDADTLAAMKQADSNPYVVLGLLNPAGKATPSKNGIPGIGQWMNENKIKEKA